ncbi:MAG: hypothetical protein KH208_06790 [Desulfovibrio sp.]|uniref:hypothetical protein n=1 Tax=Desulfovibrio sp. TaxID=885 RepID=UPI0025C657B4|nr:hypothetical protein [Desulfovibrio sp.]MBS6829564.1 hypothetical protein [Desulfovibrio sp.]
MLLPLIKKTSLYKKAIKAARQRLCGPTKDLEHTLLQYAKGVQAAQKLSFESLKISVLSFLEERKIGPDPWDYGFSSASPYSSLYSSTYAVMLRSMFLGPSCGYNTAELNKLKEYFLHFQNPDTGYFVDPTLENGEYISTDNENNQWWGYGHLTIQVLQCLKILNVLPEYNFKFLDRMYISGELKEYFRALDFGNRIAYTGNKLMNLGVTLQYDAYINQNKRSLSACNELLQLLRDTADSDGLWGDVNHSAHMKSQIIQGAYHWWVLFFYAKQAPPFSENLIDYILSTQNSLGGYGVTPHASSACEDFDSIEPLSRFYPSLSDEYKKKIEKSFTAALPWLLANQNEDGGFCFVLNQELHYGHDHLFSGPNESAMFPTWFRTLALAHLMKTMNFDNKFYFCGAPGFMF